MVTNTNSLTVGVVSWTEDDGIAWLLADTLKALGHETVDFLHSAPLPSNLDIVFAYGPFESLVPLANQLLAYPPTERPPLILWMTEQLPNPDLPEWFRYSMGLFRSKVERWAFREASYGTWQIDSRWRWLTAKGHRFRYYGDLYWLQQSGALSLLVVSSGLTAGYLQSRGFEPMLTYLGYHPDWGADLGLERDIPVLWIGKTGSARRGRLLEQIRAALRERGIDLLKVDGVEHPYVFGQERTILLNRAKIVLNLLRADWDDNSMRYCLAAPNKALVVTEPALPHSPFIPGEHIVEAPPEKIVDTICYYLSNEAERGRIVEQAYELATTQLDMKKGITGILERVSCLRQNSLRAEMLKV